jgi:hypothetical protein
VCGHWIEPVTERDHDSTATRRDYLRATAGFAATGVAGLAGCMGGAEAATGTLATRVSDQPGDITDLETCVVTIAGFWVVPGSASSEETATTTATATATATATEVEDEGEDEGEDEDEDESRQYHEFDDPQEADLVELQGDRSALLGEQELKTGTYAFLQLDVTSVEATLADGGAATVTTPGEAPLKFDQSFEIRADERTCSRPTSRRFGGDRAGRICSNPSRARRACVTRRRPRPRRRTRTGRRAATARGG